MQADPAFQQHVSGLLVPRAHVRVRQVWTSQERQLLNRSTKLLNSKGLDQMLKCQNPACGTWLERIENPDGGFTLRCGCADRVFQQGQTTWRT